MNFVAIDVETANEDLSSICQVGVASFVDGDLADAWKSFVDPQDYFSTINVSIHGIDAVQVEGAPTWQEIFPQVRTFLSNKIVLSHTLFDRSAIKRACENADLMPCECTWLDSARVVRRAWREFSKSGYGLSNVASYLGISYQAHDALEDAKCAGLILLHAIAATGIGLEQWLERVKQPVDPLGCQHAREGNPEGDLFGEVLVFTGTLSVPRQIAADRAAAAGCRVDGQVTRNTTIVVVGDQDLRKLAGCATSSKQRKAEALILKGQPIRIIGESSFMQLVAQVELLESVTK